MRRIHDAVAKLGADELYELKVVRELFLGSIDQAAQALREPNSNTFTVPVAFPACEFQQAQDALWEPILDENEMPKLCKACGYEFFQGEDALYNRLVHLRDGGRLHKCCYNHNESTRSLLSSFSLAYAYTIDSALPSTRVTVLASVGGTLVVR